MTSGNENPPGPDERGESYHHQAPRHDGNNEHNPGESHGGHAGHGEQGHRDDGVVILWKLNVQGVVIESRRPQITVRDAISLAGFNVESPWIIILKVAGHPKKEVDLSFLIDLRVKGLEKLRLTPRQINNGEAAARRLEFALLPQDEEHLDRLGVCWETLVDMGRRWLVIHRYPVPTGYNCAAVDIAIEVPVSYPGAQLDMFYCHPPIALASGVQIPQIEAFQVVTGLRFQRWSRHRQWDAAHDTLATHLALVDESLRREVER